MVKIENLSSCMYCTCIPLIMNSFEWKIIFSKFSKSHENDPQLAVFKIQGSSSLHVLMITFARRESNGCDDE